MGEQVPERVGKLYLLFKEAIEDERRAQAVYREAIDLCDDDRTRAVLQELYEDEVRHEEELLERYKALRKESGID